MSRHSFLVLLVGVSIGLQVCSCATLESAKALLDGLRNKTNEALGKAFQDFVDMADDVDTVNEDYKSDGAVKLEKAFQKFADQLASLDVRDDQKKCLQKNLTLWHVKSVDVLTTCINNATGEAFDFVHDSAVRLVSDSLSTMIEDEKSIVLCDEKNGKCLVDVTVQLEEDVKMAAGNIRMSVSVAKYILKEKEALLYNCVWFGVQDNVDAMDGLLKDPTQCIG